MWVNIQRITGVPHCANVVWRDLVGMLTDRDITVRAVAAGRDPLTTLVRDVMTPDVVYGFEDQEVEDAARLMEQ
jgi:CBS domain-containing protein